MAVKTNDAAWSVNSDASGPSTTSGIAFVRTSSTPPSGGGGSTASGMVVAGAEPAAATVVVPALDETIALP